MANLSTIYGEYMTFQADAARLKDAIATGRRRQALIDRMSTLPGPPPGYIDQQRGFLYAKMALLLCDDHRPNEAAALYDQYRRLDFAGTYTGRLFSVPYLLRAADAYLLRCYALQDSIYARESRTKAQEYASLFDSQEKELELTRTRAQSQRKTILIGASLAFIALLLLILWAVIRNLRIMKQRNRIEAQRIDELLSQKQELRKIYAASAPDTAPAASAPDATTPAADTADAPDHEYQTFIRMENTIVENRLFLNSKISREDILRATGVGKNTLVPLIKKYAGSVNLNEYINRLRLEHAVRLLRDNRVYTVDYIAEASGFNSRSTFYRVFQNIYGMTPLAVPRHPLQAGTLLGKTKWSVVVAPEGAGAVGLELDAVGELDFEARALALDAYDFCFRMVLFHIAAGGLGDGGVGHLGRAAHLDVFPVAGAVEVNLRAVGENHVVVGGGESAGVNLDEVDLGLEVAGDEILRGGGEHLDVARVGVTGRGGGHAREHDEHCDNKFLHNSSCCFLR